MDQLFNMLSNTGCIVYDIRINNHNNNTSETIEGRPLIRPRENGNQNYLDITSGMWYTPDQVSQPKLNIEKFDSLKETFSLLSDSRIEVNTIEDIKKIYAVSFLKKIDNIENDFMKIEFITNLL